MHVVEQATFDEDFQGATYRLAAHAEVLLDRAFGRELIAGLTRDDVALLKVVNHLFVLGPRNSWQLIGLATGGGSTQRVLNCGLSIGG